MERGRVVWLCVVVALLAVGAAGFVAGMVDGVYYRMRAVPNLVLPLAWTLGAVVLLLLIARRAPNHKQPFRGSGCLMLVLAVLAWPYTALQSMLADEHTVRASVANEGYVLVAEDRWGYRTGSSTEPECRVYLRQDGGPFSREVPVTDPWECPIVRVSEDGPGFVLVSGDGDVLEEIDPADHF